MTKQIYEGQTELTLRARTKVDITGATVLLIKYIKPDKSTGSFSSVIDDAIKGLIKYEIVDENDIVGIGQWTLWAHVTFASGKAAPGKPYTMEVFKEGVIC